ncbi:MAG: MATE family efflux transporter [Acidobacteria bacterium]|nr:MATE family efflux transporter [Acidobacteriota bacterium]
MAEVPPGKAPNKFDRSIVDGPLRAAIWKLAWPTMLQSAIGGLQGLVDHAMVGHYVGLAGNAAIGVSIQIFILVIVFLASVFSGMGVLVARFAGANDSDAVNKTVWQAFMVALVMSMGILAPLGSFMSPWLLTLVNAAPAVQAEALPYLRIMFATNIGMMMFFMLSGALRAAGDAHTPLRMGVAMTIMNVLFNIVLIGGMGPIPAMGTTGAAIGTALASLLASGTILWMLFTGRLVIRFQRFGRSLSLKPDWPIIRELFRFGLPTGFQGIAMNVAGVMMLGFIGSLEHSAEAQAAYAVAYTELFSLITWTSVGLMGATAAVTGQNLGAGKPDRAAQTPREASRIGLGVAAGVGLLFITIPGPLLGVFALNEGIGGTLGRQLLAYLAVSGFFVTVALTYSGGLQGTGDTKSPLYISIVSQVIVPVGLCSIIGATIGLEAWHIWTAIVLGHFTRAALSVWRFGQGKWRGIQIRA